MIYSLIPFSPLGLEVSLDAEISFDGPFVTVNYLLNDPNRVVKLPPISAQPQFKDGLYHSTCFELFVSCGKTYLEWNFSPSLDWSVFGFDSYRSRVDADWSRIPLPSVKLLSSQISDKTQLQAKVELPQTFYNVIGVRSTEDLSASITSVLDLGDRLAYMAIKHCGAKPDFHLSESFVVKL